MFCRYSLRTTDAVAGRRFYAASIGLELPEGAHAGSAIESWPLHERALAMGVPSHWLGHVAVEDAEQVAARLVALGGERLGPSVQVDARIRYATVRDPFGAVLAVRQGGPESTEAPVAWHQLHTKDAERAMAVYGDLFGWVHTQTIDVPDPEGGHRLFAFGRGREPAGAIANTARSAGVHTHWLFYFPVEDVEGAVTRVRALGGTAMAPVQLPGTGTRFAVCEDPQGAAFGVISA